MLTNYGRAVKITVLMVLLCLCTVEVCHAWSGWSNDGGGSWQYRKEITVSNTGSAVNDYQVYITAADIDTASLISQEKMQADYDDVRFADR